MVFFGLLCWVFFLLIDYHVLILIFLVNFAFFDNFLLLEGGDSLN